MAVRGIVYSRGPASLRGELGSNKSLPITLLQTSGPNTRLPSVISDQPYTISMRGDYVVTPIKSHRPRQRIHGPYSTRDAPTVRRLQETRRRHVNTRVWSTGRTRGSDVPPPNWADHQDGTSYYDRPRRREIEPVKYVGVDPHTGLPFVETAHGNRKVLGHRTPRSEFIHPRRGNHVKTETIEGTIRSTKPRYNGDWSFVDDPYYRTEYHQSLREYKPRREYRENTRLYSNRVQNTRLYSNHVSDVPLKGSEGDAEPPSDDDSVNNFKGSDLGPKEPKNREFVPHWGYYVETPPTPGQSVKPRQGSVLDPNYRPRDAALDRDLMSPKTISQSMVPSHGSTLTTPPNRVSEFGGSDEGFYEPEMRQNGPGYRDEYGYGQGQSQYPAVSGGNGYKNAPGQSQNPGAAGRYGYRNAQGSMQRGFNARGERNVHYQNEHGSNGYICTISGVLKLIEFIVSAIITGVSQVDTSLWTLHVFILFVGVCGMMLSAGSFIFRVFRWETDAHVGCLWFEISAYIVVSLLFFTSAILSTVSASIATSIVALTFFCFIGAGLFTVDTILIAYAMSKRGFQNNVDKDQDRQQQPGDPGGYPPVQRGNPTHPQRR